MAAILIVMANSTHTVFSPLSTLGLSYYSGQSSARPIHSVGYSSVITSLGKVDVGSWTRAPGSTYLLVILALSLIIGTSHLLSFQRLNHIPGPGLAAFTRLWLVTVLAKGHSASRFVDISRDYGNTMAMTVKAA